MLNENQPISKLVTDQIKLYLNNLEILNIFKAKRPHWKKWCATLYMILTQNCIFKTNNSWAKNLLPSWKDSAYQTATLSWKNTHWYWVSWKRTQNHWINWEWPHQFKIIYTTLSEVLDWVIEDIKHHTSYLHLLS